MTLYKNCRDWCSLLLVLTVASVTFCCFGPWVSTSSASYSTTAQEFTTPDWNQTDLDPEAGAATLEDWRYTRYSSRHCRPVRVSRSTAGAFSSNQGKSSSSYGASQSYARRSYNSSSTSGFSSMFASSRSYASGKSNGASKVSGGSYFSSRGSSRQSYASHSSFASARSSYSSSRSYYAPTFFLKSFTIIKIHPQFIRSFVLRQFKPDVVAYTPPAPAPSQPTPNVPKHTQPTPNVPKDKGAQPPVVSKPPQPQLPEVPRRVVVVVKKVIIIKPIVVVQSPICL